jgi:hypothetical protein
MGNWNGLRRPVAILSCFQKIAYDAHVKITSALPFSLTSQGSEKAQFRVALRKYLDTGMGYFIWCPGTWNIPETSCVSEQINLKPAPRARSTSIPQCFLVICLRC